MARKRDDRNGASEAYEYQNALSSCCTTALPVILGLGALLALLGAVIVGALA